MGLLAVLAGVLAVTEILARKATSEASIKKAHEVEMAKQRHQHTLGESEAPTTSFEVRERRGEMMMILDDVVYNACYLLSSIFVTDSLTIYHYKELKVRMGIYEWDLCLDIDD